MIAPLARNQKNHGKRNARTLRRGSEIGEQQGPFSSKMLLLIFRCILEPSRVHFGPPLEGPEGPSGLLLGLVWQVLGCFWGQFVACGCFMKVRLSLWGVFGALWSAVG